MRIFYVVIFCLLTFGISKAQENLEKITLKSGNKEKILDNGSSNYEVKLIYNPTFAIDSTRTIRGKIVGVGKEMIKMSSNVDEIYINYSCDSTYRTVRYNESPNGTLEVKIKDINTIRYNSPTRIAANKMAFKAMGFGLITGLIAAPISGFITGKFESNNYLAVAGTGLGLIVLSVPITIVTKNSNYHFKPQKDKKRTVIWEFKK